MSFKKILVAIDFSPPSGEAMRVAARLAAESGGALTIAHVWQLPMLGAELPMPSDIVQTMIDDAQKGLRNWTAEATKLVGREVTSAFVTGVPWYDLVKLLGREHFDLAVVGTHGRTGLKHVLLGSVAEKVVRHAPCAVLVVRKSD